MGVENNECIIATTYDPMRARAVQGWILTLNADLQSLFAVLPSLANGKTTIVLAPDGSKKGWPEAARGAELRMAFIQVLEGFNYSDGSSPFDYVEVGYGEFGQQVLRGNCTNRYDEREYAQMGD